MTGFRRRARKHHVVNWADLLSDTAAYLALAASALALGTIAGIALGAAAAYLRGFRAPVLALTNVGRAIPSLALLTFMVPVLGLGFAPALAALSILAAAPVAITTDVALRSVSRAAVDAARGLGMTGAQIARQVEWPLAFPIVFAGVRTAATEVIASAVLASFIGAGGLGELITTGLQANEPAVLWTGVAAIACIALAAEFALASVQRLVGGPV